MGPLRSLRKFLVALSLSLCSLLFLTLLASQVEQRLFRRRAELLLSQLQSLELRKTSWQDAQTQFQRWGPNREFDEHHLRNRGEVGEEIAGIGIRVHGRTGCPSFPEKKSGQVLVRTLVDENPSRMRVGCKSCTMISHWQSRGMRAVFGRAIKKRTGFGPHPGRQKPKPNAGGMQAQ